MRSKGHYLLWTVFIILMGNVAAYGYSSHLCNKTVEEEYTVQVPYERKINEAFQKLKLAAPSYTMVSFTKYQMILNCNSSCFLTLI